MASPSAACGVSLIAWRRGLCRLSWGQRLSDLVSVSKPPCGGLSEKRGLLGTPLGSLRPGPVRLLVRSTFLYARAQDSRSCLNRKGPRCSNMVNATWCSSECTRSSQLSSPCSPSLYYKCPMAETEL
ncbi:hypothetical protein VNO77_27288 [Canavalia gladiata]|uniref:Uncharacterized protein n=1 Tax=Canavalia gladiata TaxID=3824 RepID=A0AAN9Q6C6_CANGL